MVVSCLSKGEPLMNGGQMTSKTDSDELIVLFEQIVVHHEKLNYNFTY